MAANESLLISVVQRKNLFECYQIITELNCLHFPMKLVNHGDSSLLIMRQSLFFKKANLLFSGTFEWNADMGGDPFFHRNELTQVSLNFNLTRICKFLFFTEN